ncbi:reverse transcriptase domain-containing protein [Tanacetum coccineum]|uniref:Reverse transcriptase domain-containing protein n=1 Tax=Tanacetum coccineum TaxID=301880 RepID=A0ABQ5DGB3_9ASTR
MLGAARVQIPENNLDNLHSSREEDGTLEIMDPQDLLGSFLLADIDLIILGLLTGTLVVTTPAPVKAVEEVCVTCGSNHHFNHQGQVFQPPTNQPPVYQVPPYQAPTPQIQGVSKTDFENYVKANDENEPNLETSTEKVQNPNLENTAPVPSPGEEDSIFMEIPNPKAKKTVNVEIQDLNSPRPNSYQSRLPYPERMKVREHDKPSAQHSRFLKMFKQLRLEIGLKDALVEMPKFNKWLSSLLRNKEKLEEIAIMTVNAECSAIIMNKVPEKLEDPGKFLIPCALQELNRTSALADSGASINLLPHSIYKKLELEALTPTRMTLELANRSITHPMGIAEDVVVRVDGFTFLADFVVVNFEPDPRVPIILGRPFLRTAKALIDLYEEKLTLRVGKDELVYYADKSEKNKEKNFVHAISVIDFSKDDPFSGSTTTHSDDPSPSSSPVKTSDNFEKFADELAPLDSLPPGNDDSTLKKDLHEENFQEDVEIKNSNVSDKLVFLNTPLSDKDECFAPEDDNDEIDDFLAIEVSSNLEEGYFDSEGDIAFLDNLLSDDDSHNLDSKVYSHCERRYGYIRNHKKTIKNGQARTRERKSVQKPEAKPEKVKPPLKKWREHYSSPSPFHLAVKTRGKRKLRDKMDYSSGRIHGGKVKSVNPRQFISSLKHIATSSMEKHTWNVGFVLFLLREEAQVSLSWIASLAIRVRSLSDPTAKNKDPMIG